MFADQIIMRHISDQTIMRHILCLPLPKMWFRCTSRASVPLQTAKAPVSPLSLKWISVMVMQHFAVLVFCPGMAGNLLLHSLVKTCFVVQALLSAEDY